MMKQTALFVALLASASAFAPASRFGVNTKLAAEWKPADGAKWEETNFEKEITKLEKEAEERMDKKIEELKSKIGATGAK